MSVNLSIRNVPDGVARGLRNRAALNQRSLQQELLEILKEAVKDQDQVTLDGLLESAQRKKPALDEAASLVQAAKDAEKERAAQRFQDLLARPDDPRPGEPGKRKNSR
jgi:plasmid stability protein